jgi:hypothetical protein
MNRMRIFGLWLLWVVPLTGWTQPSRIETAAPIVLSPQEAIRQGQELVAQLRRLQPDPLTNTGVLRIRDRDRREREFAVRLAIYPTASNTVSRYEARDVRESGAWHRLEIVYQPDSSNGYFLAVPAADGGEGEQKALAGGQTMVPFAESDFWVADLGLEFLRWPSHRLVRKEMRRGQATSVLECTNPEAGGGAYSRVVAWIDTDTGGIVHADAYDSSGKLLKQFSPTHFQRIEGAYQVRQIEMRNRQTGSRSLLEFHLK